MINKTTVFKIYQIFLNNIISIDRVSFDTYSFSAINSVQN